MGKFLRELSPDLIAFIRDQQIFFTASAPTDHARVNVSPKGYDCLAVLDNQRIAYFDYAGSGNETANHVRENSRLTLMWCSFGAKPLILRTYLEARVVERSDDEFKTLVAIHWPDLDTNTIRQIFVGKIEAVQTSCGFGVPLFEPLAERPTLQIWAAKKAEDGDLVEYIEKNAMRNDERLPLAIRN